MLAGQACAVVGPAMFVCFMLGLIDFTPVRMIVGIALAIGGVVLTGSSRASTEQLMLSLGGALVLAPSTFAFESVRAHQRSTLRSTAAPALNTRMGPSRLRLAPA